MSRPGDRSVVDLEDLADTTALRAEAIAAAAGAYPAIELPDAPEAWIGAARRALAFAADEEGALSLLLRAAAAGRIASDPSDGPLAPPEVVEPALARRVFEESWLGESLYEAVRGEPARYAPGPGRIDRIEAPAPRPALPPHPRALVSSRPRGEVLYRLLRLDPDLAFDAVVTADDVPSPPTPASLVEEALRRLAAR